MAKGKTLWEMLKEKLSGPVEMKFYNPLKARIGNSVMIDEVELRDLNFFLRAIRECRRTISGQEFLFADYELLARPLNGDDVLARLRLNPADERSQAAGLSHTVLLLRLYEEMAYNEDFYNVVTDSTKRFQVLEDGEVKEEFWRINDVATSYKAAVAVVSDVNNDGSVETSEVKKLKLEYWDYWREIKDAAGQTMLEFLFVEMDGDNGWFQIWRGTELDPQHVMVI